MQLVIFPLMQHVQPTQSVVNRTVGWFKHTYLLVVTFNATESFHSHNARQTKYSTGVCDGKGAAIRVLKGCQTIISSSEANTGAWPTQESCFMGRLRVGLLRGDGELSEAEKKGLRSVSSTPTGLRASGSTGRWQVWDEKAERSKHRGHRRCDRKEGNRKLLFS